MTAVPALPPWLPSLLQAALKATATSAAVMSSREEQANVLVGSLAVRWNRMLGFLARGASFDRIFFSRIFGAGRT